MEACNGYVISEICNDFCENGNSIISQKICRYD